MWRHFINVVSVHPTPCTVCQSVTVPCLLHPLSLQQWPKLKSRLRVVFGYELWGSHLKEVEGNFGSGVVSYFIFLRWLFLMNLIIFLLWFGLVVIPQLVWVAGTNAPRTPSQLSCVFRANVTAPPRSCPRDGPLLVCVGGELEEEAERFDVNECEFERENGTLVAHRESPDSVRSVSSCNVTRSAHVHSPFAIISSMSCTPAVEMMWNSTTFV